MTKFICSLGVQQECKIILNPFTFQSRTMISCSSFSSQWQRKGTYTNSLNPFWKKNLRFQQSKSMSLNAWQQPVYQKGPPLKKNCDEPASHPPGGPNSCICWKEQSPDTRRLFVHWRNLEKSWESSPYHPKKAPLPTFGWLVNSTCDVNVGKFNHT